MARQVAFFALTCAQNRSSQRKVCSRFLYTWLRCCGWLPAGKGLGVQPIDVAGAGLTASSPILSKQLSFICGVAHLQQDIKPCTPAALGLRKCCCCIACKHTEQCRGHGQCIPDTYESCGCMCCIMGPTSRGIPTSHCAWQDRDNLRTSAQTATLAEAGSELAHPQRWRLMLRGSMPPQSWLCCRASAAATAVPYEPKSRVSALLFTPARPLSRAPTLARPCAGLGKAARAHNYYVS